MIITFSKQILVFLFGAELTQYGFLVVYLSMTIPIILLKYAPEYGLRAIGNTKPIFIGYLLISIISVIFSKIAIENYQLQGFIFGMFLSPIILSTVVGLGFLKNFKKIK